MSTYLSSVEEAILVDEISKENQRQSLFYDPLQLHLDIHKFKKRYEREKKVPSLPLVPDASSIPNYYGEQVNGRPSLISKLEERGLPGRLYERQWANFNRTVHCLLQKNIGFPLNTSEQGTGKTFLKCAVALYFDSDLFVLAPVIVNSKWIATAPTFGVTVLFAESYEKFSGRTNCNLQHPYLIRHDVSSINDKGKKKDHVTFEATPLLKEVISQRRILFVFDEVQKIKNPKNAISKACYAVIELIPLDADNVKSICCSRTPIEEVAFGESLLRMAGVLKGGKMYDYMAAIGGGYTCATPGWNAMIAIARRLSPDHTSMILQLNKTNTVSGFRWVAWLLYRDVFRPYLAGEMPKHELKDVKMDVANGFFTFDPETEAAISQQLNAISECLHMQRDRHGRDVVDMSGLAAAVPHMIELQKLKTPMFVALTRWYISVVPNAKIILFVTFKDVMALLAKQLADLGAVVMNGACSQKKRDELMARFQQPNLDCRVMISNPKVGGVGIDLDDKTGNFPRAMFLMPDFTINDLIQAMWRGIRADTKQNSEVAALFIRFVYTNTPNGAQELRILQLLHEKATIISQALAQEDASLFPSRNVRYNKTFQEMGDFDYVPLLRKPQGSKRRQGIKSR